jgi:hypothetical protein
MTRRPNRFLVAVVLVVLGGLVALGGLLGGCAGRPSGMPGQPTNPGTAPGTMKLPNGKTRPVN